MRHHEPPDVHERRRRMKRLAVLIEDDEGKVMAYELNGAALDIEVEIEHVSGTSSDRGRPGFLWDDPDRPYHDQIVLKVQGSVDKPYEAPDGWMVIKGMKRWPALKADRKL